MKKTIGSLNESSLHDAVKQLYVNDGAVTEAEEGGYVVDVLQKDRIVEIQTGSFSNIKTKLLSLCEKHPVHLVYPLPEKKIISVYDARENILLYRRKSPKKGRLQDTVKELCRIVPVLALPGFSLEVLFVEIEEVRRDDGNGSWRRKGVSIADRRLVDVYSSVVFSCPADYLQLLPEGLPDEFTNKDIASLWKTTPRNAQGVSYCLKGLGLIRVCRRQGKAQVFCRA